MSMHTITVALGQRSYPVWIGTGLLNDSERWRAMLRGRHVLVISNTTVAPLYLQRVTQALRDLHWATFLLDDGEAYKSFANVGRALEALGHLGATRDACVIALARISPERSTSHARWSPISTRSAPCPSANTALVWPRW